ncbi:ABC transporter ATP-binding protein [Planosporangium flavigriseum]|uniref:Multidrug ABC transporter ATP-binding protein n=1 Tax=Planosporangium flavigriseum TaxID=373681 RepID=A0A8J3PK40_9ACTN|nr:ABC transporter ATP-binding protein [Planosporangium flavigriseum]NJC63180.1 ABC transporter ATP-binding protein [Planosporangium flavigriseum]GIG72452.1 multidrug ABC transporter ATP-binding protein [Planosporangium flavigriseum]
MTTAVSQASTWSTLRRGLAMSPELRSGLAGTLVLAFFATAGRVAVPIAVQRGIDHGLLVQGGPDLGAIAGVVAVTALVLLVTMISAYLMNVRLYTVSETALAGIRTRTFRHIHDLSMLHQQSERRGSLVSRVTGDVDQMSQFLQWGGVILLVSLGQLTITTVVMATYSWQLTLVVYAAFAPVVFVIRHFQKRLTVAYGVVRAHVGTMLAAISESVVGAAVIRAYGVRRRTESRLDAAIEDNRRAQFTALRTSVTSFTAGEWASGLATAAVVVVGVLLGIGGHLTVGQLTAFLFLVTLFVQPVQIATEVLNEAQNAIAGWRRVLDVLDQAPDVADPGEAGLDLPPGPIDVRFSHVRFAYPGGPEVLSDVDLAIPAQIRVAVVGETGSGKTTFAKLLTRLMDPTSGQVLLSGVALTDVRFASLRRRVVMVPQDGFLFDASVADNVRFARPDISDEDLYLAFAELGLADWVDGLVEGLSTQVGERGEALSVGERQLVALARAYVADPDLLVLDEATSAVDPATEVRLQRTLDAVTRGRTTIAIAHRLSTAQAADEVLVVDRGRVVQRGPHDELVRDPESVYGRLYASWLEQTRAS